MSEAIKAAGKIIGLSLGTIILVLLAAALNWLIPVAIAWAQLGDQDLTPDEEWGMVVGAITLSLGLGVAE